MIVAIVNRYAYINTDKRVREEISTFTECVLACDSKIVIKHLDKNEDTIENIDDYEVVVLYSSEKPKKIVDDINNITDKVDFFVNLDGKISNDEWEPIFDLIKYYFEEEKK